GTSCYGTQQSQFVSILLVRSFSFFFFTATATTEIYTLSLHDALPIFADVQDRGGRAPIAVGVAGGRAAREREVLRHPIARGDLQDRKSTRLNSSHLVISYAVFCLKKKNDVHGRRDVHRSGAGAVRRLH